MANNYQIITIKTIGQTLKQNILDYFSLKEDNLNSIDYITNTIKTFDWKPILDFTLTVPPPLSNIQVNRVNITQNNGLLSESDLDIKNNLNYPKALSEVTENSLIV